MQLFYAYRITTINKQIRTAIVVAVLAIISIREPNSSPPLLYLSACLYIYLLRKVTAIGTAIACGIIGQFSNFYKMKVPAMVWLLSGIMADVIITVTMVRHIVRPITCWFACDINCHVEHPQKRDCHYGCIHQQVYHAM